MTYQLGKQQNKLLEPMYRNQQDHWTQPAKKVKEAIKKTEEQDQQ